MPITKHEDKMINLQHQLQENQQDLKAFMDDMDGWETEIKQKENKLTQNKPIGENKLPPVRNSLDKKKVKKKKRAASDCKSENGHKPARISSYDYRSWDKFDIDKALEEVDGANEGSSSEYETDDDLETERKKHLAEEEKEQGNGHFRSGDFVRAIESYSRGIDLDPTNALLPANRAMALLKQHKFGAAEVDATAAIALDPLYLKAYMRRASARVGLHKLDEAKTDYQRVLNLEPQHKSAMTELETLNQVLNRSVDDQPEVKSFSSAQSRIVMPIYKPPEMRSTKPLRRIQVEEIGIAEDTSQREAIAKVKAKQGETQKLMAAKDENLFTKFTAQARETKPTEITCTSLGGSQSPLTNVISNADNIGVASTSVTNTGVTNTGVTNTGVTNTGVTNTGVTNTGVTSCPKQRGSTKSTVLSAVALENLSEKDVPKTSFQFQADYKILKHSGTAFYQYFKRIPPGQLPALFGEMLDCDVLIHILTIFKESYIPSGDSFEEHFVSLTRVKRFDMTVMFLSQKDKTLLEDLFGHLRSTSPSKQEDISRLAKRFGVS